MNGLCWMANKIADMNKSDFSFIIEGEKIKMDYAYIIIHGTAGEDGIFARIFRNAWNSLFLMWSSIFSADI